MGSVYKRGKQFYVQYRNQGKLYREPAGPDKRDAQRYLEKRMVEIREGRFFDMKKRCKTTLEEFGPEYLAWSDRHKRSARRNRISTRNLLAYFGKINLADIGTKQVEEYKELRLSGRLNFKKIPTPRTVNLELANLRRMLNLAVEWNVLASNPLKRKLTMIPETEPPTRYLTPFEIARLKDACVPHLLPVVVLTLQTGMRKGEVSGLLWQEVDLNRKVIHLSGNRTKNGSGRTIPLNPTALGVIREALQQGVTSLDFVFHRDGKPLGDFKRSFNSACQRAGLKGVTFHTLRHTFASGLVARGVSLLTVKDLLGHADLSTTLRYSHLAPDALKAAVNEIEKYQFPEQDERLASLPERGEEVLQDAHTDHRSDHQREIQNVIPISSP